MTVWTWDHKKKQMPARIMYKRAKRRTPARRMVFELDRELALELSELPMMVRTRATVPRRLRRRKSLLYLDSPSGVWNLW